METTLRDSKGARPVVTPETWKPDPHGSRVGYRGEYWPSARCFNMPYGLAVHDDRLFVTDTANSRLLRFDSPFVGEAQALAGQPGFADKGDNRWLPATCDSLCWPYAISFAGDTAVIVDSGNNRVLLWDVAR